MFGKRKYFNEFRKFFCKTRTIVWAIFANIFAPTQIFSTTQFPLNFVFSRMWKDEFSFQPCCRQCLPVINNKATRYSNRTCSTSTTMWFFATRFFYHSSQQPQPCKWYREFEFFRSFFKSSSRWYLIYSSLRGVFVLKGSHSAVLYYKKKPLSSVHIYRQWAWATPIQ
jgi:hypothetical protein